MKDKKLYFTKQKLDRLNISKTDTHTLNRLYIKDLYHLLNKNLNAYLSNGENKRTEKNISKIVDAIHTRKQIFVNKNISNLKDAQSLAATKDISLDENTSTEEDSCTIGEILNINSYDRRSIINLSQIAKQQNRTLTKLIVDEAMSVLTPAQKLTTTLLFDLNGESYYSKILEQISKRELKDEKRLHDNTYEGLTLSEVARISGHTRERTRQHRRDSFIKLKRFILKQYPQKFINQLIHS